MLCSAGHRNAGNGHCIQGIEAMVFTHFVVESKDRYSSRNDLSLCVSLVSEGLGDNEDQEDESWVRVDNADARLINRIGFTGNGQRNGVTLDYKGAALFETQKLQRLCGEVENETLLGNSGGEIEIVRVSWGDTGDGEIGVTTKGELRMAGSMWSSDGSGVRKKSAGRRDETVVLNVMWLWSFQSLSDLADRTRLFAVRG